MECRAVVRRNRERYAIIEIGNVSYLDMPVLSRSRHAKKWIKTGGNKTRVALIRSWGTDPVALARVLGAAGPRRVGTETVQGVTTRQYAANVDSHELARLVRRRDRGGFTYDDITELRVEAWVDARHLIRRTRQRLRVETHTDVEPDPPIKKLFVETTEFGRFGPQPRIAPPPARETSG